MKENEKIGKGAGRGGCKEREKKLRLCNNEFEPEKKEVRREEHEWKT